MLRLFRASIKVNDNAIIIKGKKELVSPGRIFIPGDISSAGFFMVLGTILPNSRILIKDINLNPSRIGIIKVLKRMGSDIQVSGNSAVGFEPIGDIIIKSSKLKSTIIKKKEIPSLIDELPILMVAACFAKGESVFEGVGELRIKETDRIRSMSENLRKMGADIRVLKTLKSEKIIIQGGRSLIGATVKSFGDHRTAMSMVVAGLAAEGKTRIDNITCINKSFPNFLSLLKTIIH
jgi:3-phosphoshikimate 1-carboxyvinyltransferase